MQKETLKRLTWMIVTLLVLATWLFFSYAPTSLFVLPQVTFPYKGSGALFQTIAVLCFVLFVLIQLMLVGSTKRILHNQDERQDELGASDSGGEIKLYPMLEFISTIIPLLVTVGLAFASYQLWLNLAAR